MTLYFISGLGADERMFQKLALPQHLTIRHLAWLQPLRDEPLSSYARRMADGVDTDGEYIIIGLSFGGMVAVEMSKIIRPKQIILLSSITTKKELPANFVLLGKLRINCIVPSFFLNRIYPFTYWYFGVKKKEDKQLLREIIHDTLPRFLKWAINEILNWKNVQRPQNLTHIHGTEDHIFPAERTKADIKVKGGGHLMVYTNADEIGRILIDIIETYL